MRGKVLKGATQIVNYLLPSLVTSGNTVIDATCGNGNDTLTLARLVGEEGKVYGFDIQRTAIETTSRKLDTHHCLKQVHLI